MDLDSLFLHTLKDLEDRIKPGMAEYDVIGISALLRKLLVDSPSLVHLVNREARQKIRFKVGAASTPSDPSTVLWSLQDGLDPDTALVPAGTEEVALAGLLRKVLIISGSQRMTVKDVIKHAANVTGGVHAGSPRDEGEKTLATSDWNIGGYPLGIRDLQAIARVTIKGLQPLRKAIEARREG